VPDILAIVSKAIFEKDARIGAKLVAPNDVWPVDRYTSTNKALQSLKGGGRIFLVTVRPPSEKLWFLGVVESPSFNGSAWISKSKNTLPVTDITPLRRTIAFESGKGISQEKGMLGMSLQAPRALARTDVTQILDVVGGAPIPTEAPPSSRVIDGKYEILGRLGEGGMGVVYEARHKSTGRRVALKEIIDEELLKNKSTLERFQREARATGAIESQHIALVLDSGIDPGTQRPFLVMELLKGEDLQQLLSRCGKLPEDLALRIVAQACTGLVRAHEAGVVHRDIKPANLFLAERDGGEIVVKLLDFGIARVREELQTTDRGLTSTGLMLGSPLYMSPEQVRSSKKVDHRTDLWSLGVVLYESLAGETPHADAETLGDLLVTICSSSAPPLAHPRSSPIVAKALDLKIDNRYATASDLLSDLKKELPNGIALDPSMFALPSLKDPANTDAELAETVRSE